MFRLSVTSNWFPFLRFQCVVKEWHEKSGLKFKHDTNVIRRTLFFLNQQCQPAQLQNHIFAMLFLHCENSGQTEHLQKLYRFSRLKKSNETRANGLSVVRKCPAFEIQMSYTNQSKAPNPPSKKKNKTRWSISKKGICISPISVS